MMRQSLCILCGCLWATTAVAWGQAADPLEVNVFARAYAEMSLEQLEQAMANDVPTRRLFVAKAIATHDAKAWPMLKRSLHHADWRVRSTALAALAKLLPQANDRHVEKLQQYPGIGDELIARTRDDNAWVRCQTAALLGNIGTASEPLAERLIALCGEDDAWVRTSAIEAVRRIPGFDADVRLRSSINVLSQPRTGFGDSRFAMDILLTMDASQLDAQKLTPALVQFLSHPGQGMWNNNLVQGLALLASLNPEPAQVLPLYRKVLTEAAYEQQALRTHLCKILQSQPKQYTALLPQLRAALAREKSLIGRGLVKDTAQQTALQQTIQAIEADAE